MTERTPQRLALLAEGERDATRPVSRDGQQHAVCPPPAITLVRQYAPDPARQVAALLILLRRAGGHHR